MFWSIDLRSFVVVAGTALTLLGVALFATWSLLSNITAFFTENRETILYPNNLVLGRPTLIHPRDRLGGVDKLPPQAAVASQSVVSVPGSSFRERPARGNGPRTECPKPVRSGLR